MNEWDTFSALETHLWARLAQAVARSSDPWRYVTLATIGSDGPEARLVGLRAADRQQRVVEVHTDTRTPKVAQLRADPRAQLLFWDAARQEQLRLSVRMELITGDPVRWARVPDGARGNYGTDPVPGTPLTAAEEYRRTPESGRLCALVGQVVAMDAVTLRHSPHRRALWRDGTWSWVAP